MSRDEKMATERMLVKKEKTITSTANGISLYI